jgi:hypothetical protein
MIQINLPPWLPWVIVLTLGILVGALIFDDTTVRADREELQIQVDSLYSANVEIVKQMDLINDSLVKVDFSRARIARAMQTIIDNEGRIEEVYRPMYLSLDTVDWVRLDSLSTIILYGDSEE